MFVNSIDIRSDRGTAIIVALSFLAVLMIMMSAFVSNLLASSNFESSLEASTKSFYIAEAGLSHAVWKLGKQAGEYRGEAGVVFGDGSFDIEIRAVPEAPEKRIIISRARLDGYPEGRTESEVRAVVVLQGVEGGRFEIAVDSWEAPR